MHRPTVKGTGCVLSNTYHTSFVGFCCKARADTWYRHISAGQRQGEVCKVCAQAELSLSGPSSLDGISLGLHGLRPSVCMTERAAVPKALLKPV